MDSNGLKTVAENVLREMPFVVGAFVQPDAFGHLREIHLLIQPGPKPREVAHEVKTLLETRLRVPIDQRIISIAQLAEQTEPDEPVASPPEAGPATPPAATTRLQLTHVEAAVLGARVTVSVALEHDGVPCRGEATEFEAEDGRARAGARAALDALNSCVGEKGRFGFDFAARVEALDQLYVLVSVVASGRAIGRKPVSLAGAHPVEEPDETAAALAVLKATNRSLELMMSEAVAPPRRRRPVVDL